MWAASYIGIPFVRLGRSRDGVDCYGLHWLIEYELRRRVLPRWDDKDFDPRDVAGIAGLFDQGRGAYEPVATPAAHDVILLIVDGAPGHMGVMVDRRRFIHACDHLGAVRSEQLGGLMWPDRKVGGVFRYTGGAGACRA